MPLPKEENLQNTISNYLLSIGYEEGQNPDFSFKYNIFQEDMLRFLIHTQEKELEIFKSSKGSNWKDELFGLIDKEIKNKGIIDVLRHGINDFSLRKPLKLMFFKPNTSLNEELNKNYRENIFKVSNEFHYTTKNLNRIDNVISINGLPLIFIEVKNNFTNQNAFHAIKQWKTDRDESEKIFKERALVFFALDDSEVYMASELKGKSTYFLPFNKGYKNGKGNPSVDGKYKTHYIWEDILSKNTLTSIINKFYFIQKETNGESKKTKIFPRYHQLDVVRKLIEDVYKKGAGVNYLIQHSAGSGKTNSISWLAHRLSSLHNKNNEIIFNSIIVITDRKVLDRQLQDAIYQLEHKHGVVERIDENKNSGDLAKAIENNKKIIITTIQKFPYALEKIENLSGKNYAVIIDEAHSSTAGESMGALKETLAGKTLEEAKKENLETKSSLDKMDEILEKRSKLDNISFFAFTATPKNKTLQIFGTKDLGKNKASEFHLYSMKQAIEEKFILDVLKNYTTYKTYYRVAKTIENDPEFDKSKAKKAITRFATLNEHNIRAKVEIIVNDFINNRGVWIKGQAKAMIVTPSRLHAVRYKIAIDKYLKEKDTDIKSLVAFSGKVIDDEIEYTESSMNNIKNIPSEFNKNEYKFLIVAEKYQTGFNQPKLCVMYVDKTLGSVKCVQTLSRLNRRYKEKETFILDFVNEAKDVQEAFKPYYETTNIDKMTDPNLIFEKFYKIKEFSIYDERDVEDFAILYFKKKRTEKQDAKMNSIIDSKVEIYNTYDDEMKDELKSVSREYINLYKFLLQMYSIKNLDLLKLYVFLIGLYKKLPKNEITSIKLDELLKLDYYKLEKISEGNISISKGEGELHGPSGGKSLNNEENLEGLDEIIERLNNLYGAGLTEKDKIMFENIKNNFSSDEKLKKIALVNTEEDFSAQFKSKFFIRGLVTQNKKFGNLVKDIISNPDLSSHLMDIIAKEVYEEFRASAE